MTDLSIDSMPPFAPQQRDGALLQSVVVLNRHGLHARPSAKFFEKVLMPHSDQADVFFRIGKDASEDVPIVSVFDLMGLGLEAGTFVTVKLVSTGDESPENLESIMQEIHTLFSNCFNDNG